MSPRPLLPRAVRHARSLFSLGIVGLLALPLIAASNTVEVSVDGEQQRLRTYAATVADVLDELEVDVEPADEVSPELDASLSDGLEIEIERAIEVDVLVDGRFVERVHEPVGSVAGVLEAADLGDVRDEDAVIEPAWTAPVEDGDVVEVLLPRTVSLHVDGESHEVTTHVETVGHLLVERDVELGDDDEVTPAPGEPLDDDVEVVVERVDFDEVVEEVVLERGEQRRETDDLDRGTTRVDDEGADGLRRDTYRVEIVDGEEVDRELVDREVVTEPRDRVVLVGTHVPPPPPPPPPPEPTTPSGSVWDRLAQCESGGNWRANTGNGYYGGLQFHPDTWRSVGGSGLPHEHSRQEQIRRGEILQSREGWSPWPHCSRQLGLR